MMHVEQEANSSDKAKNLNRKPRRILKGIVKYILNLAKISHRSSITPGISVFGWNFFCDSKPPEPHKFHARSALDYAISLQPKTVIDVGSGGGHHANEFLKNGSKVLCIDYGTSVYAKESTINGLDIITIDFNKFEPKEKFDLVWASHILEHQRNIGLFIEKLIECCSENGHICITLPDPHGSLWGGHLSLWNPGLLVYNILLCGIDVSNAIFIKGHNEFSMFFKPIKIALPDNLTYDCGDLVKLSEYLPPNLSENSDFWNVRFKPEAANKHC